jgi:hypothetical protein
MPLYEVAILEKPTVKESEDGVLETLVYGPTAIVGRDSQDAAMSAMLNLLKEHTLDRSRLQVLARPFA